jgi:UDP-3-O-[3-hydroxymyristoyl] glucosamine N-acyltransferase
MKIWEIAKFLSSEVAGDGESEITGISDLHTAKKGDLAFFERSELPSTAASCVIVGADFSGSLPCPVIKVKDPKLAFARISRVLFPSKLRPPTVHPTATIARDARIGKEVYIDSFVCIGEGSDIGDGCQLRTGVKVGDKIKVGTNCVFHPNVVVEDGCTIGDGVILHSGVVIGADGFGYVRDEENAEYHKFPQIGTVVIENNVEIGANTCIDRGALGETRIGEGTKIDNLVQIAHNVQIGKRVIIAAQTGISGSTVIEDDCVIGGQVGMGDHARVKSGAVIGSQAGVLPGKIVRPGVWWGTPVQPLEEFKKQNAMVKGLSRLRDEVRSLREQLDIIKRRTN